MAISTVTSVFCGEMKGSFGLWHKRGANRQTALCQALGEARWLRVPMPILEADRASSLLYIRKLLFHPVFDRVVFILLTLIPRCSGQKFLGF